MSWVLVPPWYREASISKENSIWRTKVLQEWDRNEKAKGIMTAKRTIPLTNVAVKNQLICTSFSFLGILASRLQHARQSPCSF